MKFEAKTFEEADFSCDRMVPAAKESLMQTIGVLEKLRVEFVETKDKDLWYSLIQLLPSSYNQMRTCTHELREHCEHVFCAPPPQAGRVARVLRMGRGTAVF